MRGVVVGYPVSAPLFWAVDRTVLDLADKDCVFVWPDETWIRESLGIPEVGASVPGVV
jgi:hypothetical protein